MPKITDTTLRLFNLPPVIIGLLDREGILPFDIEDIDLLDIHELKMLKPAIITAKFDDNDNLLSYTQGGGDALRTITFTHNAEVIESLMEFQHGVKVSVAYRPDGRLLRESVYDSYGDRTVRGEYIYHHEHRNAIAQILTYPTDQEVSEIPQGEGKDPEFKVKIFRRKDDKGSPVGAEYQHATINDKGLVTETRDIDGVKQYTYHGDTDQIAMISEQLTSGFDESQTLTRVTENEFDDRNMMISSKLYIDPANPIQHATFRNEYDDKGRFMKTFRSDEASGAEGMVIDFSAYWAKHGA